MNSNKRIYKGKDVSITVESPIFSPTWVEDMLDLVEDSLPPETKKAFKEAREEKSVEDDVPH